MHALHKNMHNCTRLFRSFSFFLLLLFSIWQKPSFFVFFLLLFLYLFHHCRCRRRQKESCYSIQCLDNNVICVSAYLLLLPCSRRYYLVPRRKKRFSFFWSFIDLLRRFLLTFSLSLTNYSQLFINLHV